MTACLVLTCLLAAPQVEVSTLDGKSARGALTSLSAERLTVQTETESFSWPTSELLEFRVIDPAATAAQPLEGAAIVRFTDGSRLQLQSPQTKGEMLTGRHPIFENVSFRLDSVRSLQLAADDPAIQANWQQLLGRNSKRDMLVVRKGAVLDHLDGVVGAMNEQGVKFLLDGDEVVIKRDRIFGVIYARKETASPKGAVRLELAGGDSLFARRAVWSESGWEIELAPQTTVKAPTEAVRVLDFSLGRVLYLSTVEPREHEFTSYFGGDFGDYQRDRSIEWRPLMVGNRVFTRGLAIHSRNRLQYRLGGEYRRFVAVLGIDPEIRAGVPNLGLARLSIRGDGKVLYDEDVRAGQPSQTLDLPVAGVVDLEIFVDYGPDKVDFGDRVHLGDAKVLK